MVASPQYERLKVFMEAARANKDLDAWDKDHEKALKGISDAIDHLHAYRNSHGFTGATGDAMNQWVDASIRRIEWYREKYTHSYKGYETGRQLMATALSEAEKLSPDLLDANTAAMRDDLLVSVPSSEPGTGIRFMGKLYTTGSAYVAAVEAQANEAREKKSAEILAQMRRASFSLASSLRECTEAMKKIPDSKYGTQFPVPPPSPTPVVKEIKRGNVPVSHHDPSVYGGDRDTDFGRSDQRDPKSGVYPDGYDEGGRISDRIMSSKRIPNTFVPEGELGSRLNPVTDPNDLMNIDLLHSRVNGDRHANGVIGGHTPASPIDREHPLWRLNGGPAKGSGLGAGALAAGALGAGALGAGALGMRGSLSLNSATTGAAGAGVGGAVGAGGAGGAGAAGAGGAAGRPGMGGFMGAGAGAGGKGKEDRKARRHRYTAFRFEDDEDELPEGYVNPLSQTYGSDKDLSPAPRKDDGWDPRQW